jgi:uncharacterized membrane protein
VRRDSDAADERQAGLLDRVVERYGAGRVWAATGIAVLLTLALGMVVAPRAVYDGFLWQYLWGPVYADAHNAICAVHGTGGSEALYDPAACRQATGVVAEPGYTRISTAVYMLTLLYALAGVVVYWEPLQDRLGVTLDRGLFYALVPIMLFGGALRTVEDAFDAGLRAGATPPITFPWNTWLISPQIYVTVFLIAVALLVLSRWLSIRGVVESYQRALFAGGSAVLAITLGVLVWLSLSTAYATFLPQFTILTVGIATVLAGAIWWLLERYRPAVNAGTGRIGAVVIWGHAIDGTANVLGLDWAVALGYPGGNLRSKHVVNQLLVDLTEALLPPDLIAQIGTAWPFLLVKLVVPVAVIWVFDERIFEESPRYAYLLLIAILAVGLGPGTRDMLRLTFGI